jgi:hypothetical protein
VRFNVLEEYLTIWLSNRIDPTAVQMKIQPLLTAEKPRRKMFSAATADPPSQQGYGWDGLRDRFIKRMVPTKHTKEIPISEIFAYFSGQTK